MTVEQREQKQQANLRKDQSNLSYLLATRMVWNTLDTGDAHPCSLFTDGASPDVYASLTFEDKEMWRNAVAGDIDTPLHVTLLSYIEAMEKNPPTVPTPLRKLTEGEAAIIMCRHGNEYGPRLEALYAALLDYDGPLPPLGTLKSGILTPSRKSMPRKERHEALNQRVLDDETPLQKAMRCSGLSKEELIEAGMKAMSGTMEDIESFRALTGGAYNEVPMIIGTGKAMKEEVILRRLREEAGTQEQVVDCLIRFGLVKRIYK